MVEKMDQLSVEGMAVLMAEMKADL